MFIFYLIFSLAPPDLSPVDEAVAVIDKEHREADYHRQIRRVVDSRHYPHNNQHNIICGVAEPIERRAQECERRGDKARCDGYSQPL